MTYTYTPKGVCSRKMTVELDEGGVIKALRVDGGCSGNLQGISRLVVGMTAQDWLCRPATLRFAQKTDLTSFAPLRRELCEILGDILLTVRTSLASPKGRDKAPALHRKRQSG